MLERDSGSNKMKHMTTILIKVETLGATVHLKMEVLQLKNAFKLEQIAKSGDLKLDP